MLYSAVCADTADPLTKLHRRMYGTLVTCKLIVCSSTDSQRSTANTAADLEQLMILDCCHFALGILQIPSQAVIKINLCDWA